MWVQNISNMKKIDVNRLGTHNCILQLTEFQQCETLRLTETKLYKNLKVFEDNSRIIFSSSS